MSTIIMYVYLLSNDDVAAMNALNAIHQTENPPRVVIPMDYGSGPCVDTYVLDDPTYVEWRDALDDLDPIASRTVTEIVYESPF